VAGVSVACPAIRPLRCRSSSERESIVARYTRELPSAVSCFEEDFHACVAHLRFPAAQRIVIRTTNLLERLFGKERRRTKGPNAFGELPVLKLMYAAIIRASEKWRGIEVTSSRPNNSPDSKGARRRPTNNVTHPRSNRQRIPLTHFQQKYDLTIALTPIGHKLGMTSIVTIHQLAV